MMQARIKDFLERYKLQVILSLLFLWGYFLGITHYCSWDDIVENVLFKTGQVDYPLKSPQYVMQERLHSFFYFVSEVLHRFGLSLYDISIFLSGLLAGINLMLLGYISYTIYPSFYAIIVSLFIEYFWLYDFGVNYDITMLDTQNPQGNFGLTVGVFTLYHFFKKTNKKSFFFLGLVPIFHLTLGFWVNAVTVLSSLIKKKRFSKEKYLSYFLGSGATLIFYLTTLPKLSIANKEVNLSSYITYLQHWDLHQVPYVWNDLGIWLALLFVVFLYFKRSSELKDLFIPHLLFTIFALFHGILGHTLINILPLEWWFLMATRLLNFSIYIVPIYVLTKLLKDNKLGNFIGLACFILLFIDSIAGGRAFLFEPSVKSLYQAIVFVLFTVSLFIIYLNDNTKEIGKKLKCGSILVSLFICLFIVTDRIRYSKVAMEHNRKEMKYYKNNDFFMSINKEADFLLSAPSLKQFLLKTGVPVIVEIDTIDDILYNPYLADDISNYLIDLYNIDFYNPQKEFRNDIELIDNWVKSYWESLSRDRWLEIKTKYKLTHVLVPDDWELKGLDFRQGEGIKVYSLK